MNRPQPFAITDPRLFGFFHNLDLLIILLLSGTTVLGQSPQSDGFPQPFNSGKPTNGPMPVGDVIAQTNLPPGFRLTAFAAEPDVQQPIAMTTDARGRLWVAKNYTYSEASVGYHPQLRDRIVVFEDTHNDGHFNKRTVFWDGAQRLTSIEVGLGGVWAL